jgi:SAF domain
MPAQGWTSAPCGESYTSAMTAVRAVRALWIVAALMACVVSVAQFRPTEERAWQPQKASASWIAIRFVPKGARLSPDAYSLIVGGEGAPAAPPPKPAAGRVAVRNIRPGELYRVSDFRRTTATTRAGP